MPPTKKPVRKGKVITIKATTKKGAYKKAAKARFGRRRRPFVETKTRESISVNMNNRTPPAMGQTFDVDYPNILDFQNLPVDDAFTLLEPRSFTRMCQGIGEDKMIGESVFSRFVKQKVTFRYPSGSDQIAFAHSLYLISGWITLPIGLSDTSTNTWGNPAVAIPSISSVDFNSLKSYIAYQVKQYFNEREDKMRFIPKQTTNIRIDSYRKVRTDRNSQTSMLPSTGDAVSTAASAGQLPDIHMSNTWKVNRKVHYVKGKEVDLTYPPASGQDTENWFPNYQHLPWTIVYNPNFANQKNPAGTAVNIQLCHNDQHWYTDA